MVTNSIALAIGQHLLHGVLELLRGPGGKECVLRFRPGIVPDSGPIDSPMFQSGPSIRRFTLATARACGVATQVHSVTADFAEDRAA